MAEWQAIASKDLSLIASIKHLKLASMASERVLGKCVTTVTNYREQLYHQGPIMICLVLD